VYCCRSGSAADTQAIADIVNYYLQSYAYANYWYSIRKSVTFSPHRQVEGEPPSVKAAAELFQRLCYENKDYISAGIIVGGWDKEAGPSVYSIPLGGGIFKQPWAIGGLLNPFSLSMRFILMICHRLWIDIRLWLLRCDI